MLIGGPLPHRVNRSFLRNSITNARREGTSSRPYHQSDLSITLSYKLALAEFVRANDGL